jgi:hypothetical protein
MRWEQVDELRADPGRAPAEHDESAKTRRRSVLPAIAVVAAAASFGGVIWFAYQEGRESGHAGPPPVVKADEGPTKVKPDQPGGLDVPFQSSTVYDRLGQPGQKPTAEKLLPPPEAPVQRIQAPPPIPPVQAAGADPASPTALAPQPGAPLRPSAPQPAAGPSPLPVPVAEAASATTPAAAGGAYRIQIGSVKTNEAVAAEWARLKHRYPEILGPLKVSGGKVDLPGKGTFYRVQGGPLDESGAKSACDHLKRQGVGCIVVKS